jgi:hypothetical protein
MGGYLYVVGGVIVMLAFFLGRRGGNAFNARNITGSNVVNGTVSGTVNQSVAQPAPTAAPATKERGDRIAWAIALVGAAIAGAQPAHDILKSP